MDLHGHRQVAYVALAPDQDTLVGVARYVRLEHDPAAAEVAIEIADDWQRTGVGTLLLASLIDHARRAGVARLVAITLSENHAARALAHAAGFSARGASGPQRRLQLLVPTVRGDRNVGCHGTREVAPSPAFGSLRRPRSAWPRELRATGRAHLTSEASQQQPKREEFQ